MGQEVEIPVAPVPPKLAECIRRWEFVDMGELLPEFWATAKDEDLGAKRLSARRPRKVSDIGTWVQCFCSYMYVKFLGTHAPEVIPAQHHLHCTATHTPLKA